MPYDTTAEERALFAQAERVLRAQEEMAVELRWIRQALETLVAVVRDNG